MKFNILKLGCTSQEYLTIQMDMNLWGAPHKCTQYSCVGCTPQVYLIIQMDMTQVYMTIGMDRNLWGAPHKCTQYSFA